MNNLTILRREVGITVLALICAGSIGLLATGYDLTAIVIPLLLAGGATLFFYPVLGLYLFAVTIPLESALMVGDVTVARMLGVAVFGTWIVRRLLRREPFGPLVDPGLVRVALLLFGLMCLSLVWAEYPQLAQRHLITAFQLVLLTVLVLDLTSSWKRVAWVAKGLVLAATVAALLTVEQYFLGGARRAGEGITGGLNRTAVTLVTILPFAFFLLRSSEAALWRWLGLTYIGLSAVAVGVTFSRMNYLMFPLVVMLHVLLMIRTKMGRRRVALLGTAAVVAISFLPMDVLRDRATTIAPYLVNTVDADRPTEAYSTRGFLMRAGVAMFRDQPLLGVGWQNFGMRFYLDYQWQIPGVQRIWGNRHVPHGSHITFLSQLGIVGFLLWTGLFAMAARSLWKSWHRVTEGPMWRHRFMIQALAIAIGLQFLYGFYDEVHGTKILWLLLGLAAGVNLLTATPRAVRVDFSEPSRSRL